MFNRKTTQFSTIFLCGFLSALAITKVFDEPSKQTVAQVKEQVGATAVLFRESVPAHQPDDITAVQQFTRGHFEVDEYSADEGFNETSDSHLSVAPRANRAVPDSLRHLESKNLFDASHDIKYLTPEAASDQFEKEPNDYAWSTQMQANLYAELNENLNSQALTIGDISCKSVSCKIQIRPPEIKTEMDMLATMQKINGALLDKFESMTVNITPNESGTVDFNVYTIPKESF